MKTEIPLWCCPDFFFPGENRWTAHVVSEGLLNGLGVLTLDIPPDSSLFRVAHEVFTQTPTAIHRSPTHHFTDCFVLVLKCISMAHNTFNVDFDLPEVATNTPTKPRIHMASEAICVACEG